ncbi:MAG: hypothetical protein AAFV90_29875 [Cyanobacteria bacterium J06634_5]
MPTAKQKVTLYLPDDLHRQFKIRSAVDGETMSLMAQRAIEFYLEHADVVEDLSIAYGQAHRIHSCPKCAAPVALHGDGLSLVSDHAKQPLQVLENLEPIPELSSESKRLGGEELVKC